ncbi:autoinducer binding domain-containing protein [Cochlodiniinecator piscidefendens]|uniref:autoinducer binding domain-containing protein n=1 Tax=Cochlodiniinecator piscidefendens TaxID=2715756 RepID=UPI00140B72F9|nr:autoinducer binding domain-containing protein [Cochlodiniinecator piscidefendens]
MDQKLSISPLLADLEQSCPSGYALAMHIKYTTPNFLFQTYPMKWIEYYSMAGLVLHDPIVRWGFENTGATTWGALGADDPKGVVSLAAEHGMKFGTVISLVEDNSRTIGGFARPDRDHTPEEVADLSRILHEVHHQTRDTVDLPAEERAALKRLSITLTHS